MTDLAWSTLRDRAIRSFNGELPNASTEQDLIDAFQANAFAVRRLLDDISEGYANGKMRSGWAVWRARALSVHPSRDVVADTGGGREQRVPRAEAWVRNVGVHYDREGDVEDELFGDLGRLRELAGDSMLRERLLRLWGEQRPRGERCEEAVLERAEEWKATRARLAGVAAGRATAMEAQLERAQEGGRR